ncbi:hypothetical protein SSCG_03692 [Streptomyces clavuligerus]|nr:hypothetical protein SSCG_03692 [Streptomyces clavuligerus]
MRKHLAAFGAGLLNLPFAVSMSLSMPPQEQFHYGVFVPAAGMLVLASGERPPLPGRGAGAAPGAASPRPGCGADVRGSWLREPPCRAGESCRPPSRPVPPRPPW